MTTNIPYITNIGRKGGSNVAASVVNALLILARQDQEPDNDPVLAQEKS
jgi:precorrin isomerase